MTKRTLAAAITAALVAGAIMVPATDAVAKKKKKKKSPPIVACAPYEAGEQGTDKPTVIVTGAHTAEAPLEQTVTLAQSFADFVIIEDPATDFFNVQVDSAADSAGLYLTFEFPTRRDYDLYVRWSDGSEAASSHGFNPLAEAHVGPPSPIDPSNTSGNHAGETTASSESIVGLTTPDCGGYTIETQNWLGEGGDFAIKLWLGEGTTEPLPQGD